MPRRPNLQTLARELDCSRSRVSQMKAKGMPVDSVAAARDWKAANVRPRVDVKPSRPSAPAGGLEEAKRREAMARAETAELDLAERRGDLVPLVGVRQAAEKLGRLTRDALQGMPVRVAPKLHAAESIDEVERVLGDAIRAVLTDVAKLTASDINQLTRPHPGDSTHGETC